MKLVLVVCLALNAFQSDAASLRRSGRSKLTFIEVRGVFQTSHMAPRKRYVQTRVTISFCSKICGCDFFLVQLPQYGHHQMYFSNLFGELLESLSQQTCLEKNNQGRLMIFLVAYRDFSLPGLLLDGCSF